MLINCILHVKRPAYSIGERLTRALIKALCEPFAFATSIDKLGNITIQVGNSQQSRAVMFASHFDTVHAEPQQRAKNKAPDFSLAHMPSLLKCNASASASGGVLGGRYHGDCFEYGATALAELNEFVARISTPNAQALSAVRLQDDRTPTQSEDNLNRISEWSNAVCASFLPLVPAEYTQSIIEKNSIISLANKKDGCLGADCGAGLYIMVKLIHAGVHGRYTFFTAEEIGCVGSGYYADNLSATEREEIKQCISFDRKGTTSVITQQRGRRCCSEAYAKAFCQQLNASRLFEDDFTPDPTGVYTDSAEFMSIVPECTNISVGYHHQHTSSETQDAYFLELLILALTEMDFMALPIKTKSSNLALLDGVVTDTDVTLSDVIRMLHGRSRFETFSFCYHNPDLAAEVINYMLDFIDVDDLDEGSTGHYFGDAFDF